MAQGCRLSPTVEKMKNWIFVVTGKLHSLAGSGKCPLDGSVQWHEAACQVSLQQL